MIYIACARMRGEGVVRCGVNKLWCGMVVFIYLLSCGVVWRSDVAWGVVCRGTEYCGVE